ncbi:hypothetical protein NQ117_07800 [Paenibacillus sp. SC116]|nr:hypothetical protein [Paenibacillus sp. SC116]
MNTGPSSSDGAHPAFALTAHCKFPPFQDSRFIKPHNTWREVHTLPARAELPA